MILDPTGRILIVLHVTSTYQNSVGCWNFVPSSWRLKRWIVRWLTRILDPLAVLYVALVHQSLLEALQFKSHSFFKVTRESLFHNIFVRVFHNRGAAMTELLSPYVSACCVSGPGSISRWNRCVGNNFSLFNIWNCPSRGKITYIGSDVSLCAVKLGLGKAGDKDAQLEVLKSTVRPTSRPKLAEAKNSKADPERFA